MHYPVLVIGPDPYGQLTPYYEENVELFEDRAIIFDHYQKWRIEGYRNPETGEIRGWDFRKTLKLNFSKIMRHRRHVRKGVFPAR